jgi:arginase
LSGPMASSRNARKAGTPVLVGVPFDANSSYLRGTAQAPAAIRSAFHSSSSNYWTELGIDLSVKGVYEDIGDVDFEDDAFAAIEKTIGDLVDHGARPLSLGGDHSVTFPLVRAIGKRAPGLTILHFDAHPDLYAEFEGNRHSHACPFARIMEERLAARLVQVGIRTLNGHQRDQAARFGVEIIEMRDLPALDKIRVNGPVYVSLDMDVLDPAFAPGISHREPGGMSVREVLSHLHAMVGEIVGADIVEFNPVQDVSNVTAMVAAKLVKEMLGLMIITHR